MTKKLPWPLVPDYVGEGGTKDGLTWQVTRRRVPRFVGVSYKGDGLLYLLPEPEELRVRGDKDGCVRVYSLKPEPVACHFGSGDCSMLALGDVYQRAGAWLMSAAIERHRRGGGK